LRQIHADLAGALGLAPLLAGQGAAPEGFLDACSLPPEMLPRDEELRRLASGFLYCLQAKSDHAFYWLGRLIDRQRDSQGAPRFGGRKDLLNVVGRLLAGFAQVREGLWGEASRPYPENFRRLPEVIGVLKKWYDALSHRERPVYLYHAVLLVVRRDEIDWEQELPAIDTPVEEVEALYRAHLEGPPIELDDFVYDIHAGKREGDGLTRFAREGALVANEERAFRHEGYRKLYQALKERLDVYRRRGLAGVAEVFGGAPCAT
jgi:hypothetical protein